MKDIHDIHDRGYKKLFSNKTIFRQLIETFVHETWVNDVNFDQCHMLDKSFIADHYKETESDLIYQLQLKGKEAYIVVLLEFQSTVERFMAVRVLNYITNFYMDYVQSHKRIKTLPPVFPLVLYSGKKTWTAPLKLTQIIQNHEILGQFAPNFEYFTIDEQAFPKEVLLKIHNIVSTLFLAEVYYDIDLLIEVVSALLDKEEDHEAFWLLVNWFLQLTLHGHIDQEHYQKLERMITTKEEVKTMLVEAIEQDRKTYYEKGKQEAKREYARVMLAKGLSITLIAEITGLAKEEIVRLNDTGMNSEITNN